ncbi:MAG: metal ABC transporter permease [Verrucomicrobiales bacterium]
MACTFPPINIITMFTEAYMQRALAAAMLLAPLCAILGVFVTARRMSFFSDTIAHGALAGIALGFWFGLIDPTLPMIAFSLLVAWGIVWLKDNTDLPTDTIMALLLSGSVALGIIILSMLKGNRAEIHSYLFGDILAVEPRDVTYAAVLFAVILTGIFSRLSPLTLLAANEELAFVTGVRVRWANLLFIVALTVTVALSIRLLGIILVTSLLVVPSAAARNISRNLRQQIIGSFVAGLLGGFVGIVVSYRFDVPSGPAIVLTCICLFIITLLFSKFLPKRAVRPA